MKEGIVEVVKKDVYWCICSGGDSVNLKDLFDSVEFNSFFYFNAIFNFYFVIYP